VLIRHNWAGNQEFLIQGRTFVLAEPVTLTVASGPDAGETMTAYTIRYP
jgi:hypothetical protein